jgi:hypothetical protein
MLTQHYVAAATGVPAERLQGYHASTRERTHAYALALPIPMIIWAVSSFVVANSLFGRSPTASLAVSGLCALLIYLVERLVMISPRKWYVSVCRLFIALMTAVLGACAFDLVLFAPEIEVQIRTDAREKLEAQYDARLSQQGQVVTQKKADWETAQQAANCEADGTCGTRRGGVAKVWREKDRQAKLLRQDYLDAVQAQQTLSTEKDIKLGEIATSSSVLHEAGLLARLEALHKYTVQNPAAKAAWLMLFMLMVALETVVILIKYAFGETVDDHIERSRERLNHRQVSEYVEAQFSPEARARLLIDRAV